jgi:hypothetical protein
MRRYLVLYVEIDLKEVRKKIKDYERNTKEYERICKKLK